MPSGSTVVITYDGSDITSSVLFESASFESQLNAQPGTFELKIKDPNKTHYFTTGKEISLSLDGVKLYGGYVTSVERTFAFPAVDTSSIDAVDTRQWVLRGVDYNILFDKRVLRDNSNPPDSYLQHLPFFTKSSYDGNLIKTLVDDFLDVPGDLIANVVTSGEGIYNIIPPFDPLNQGTSGEGSWMQQGSTWRSQMEDFAQFSGAVWYIDANKRLIYRSLENSQARWGFSDGPNKQAITTSPVAFQSATYGFRELDLTEDGSNIVNEAFVWGGSAFGSTDGGTFFGHASNSESITKHGLWQFAEAEFGSPLHASQDGVDVRAGIIVTGDPTLADPREGRGLVWPQWNVRLTWFGHDVPLLSGTPNHLRPGDLVTMIFYSLKDLEFTQALIRTLPLRSIRISFPELDPTGKGYVRFEGFFGLQLSDPYTLWRYLLQRNSLAIQQSNQIAVPTANNNTTAPLFGSYGQFLLQPTPNGSNTVFNLPNFIGYVVGTSTVFVNGLFQRPGIDYNETSPANGEITFVNPPSAGAECWVVCYTTGSTGGA